MSATRVTYDVMLYGKDGSEHDVFDLVRVEEPIIRNKAGQVMYQQAAAQRVREVLLKDVPVTELGALLQAVATAAAPFVRGVYPE